MQSADLWACPFQPQVADRLTSHPFRERRHIVAELRVTIEQQESVRWHVRPCLSHLLHDAESSGISRDVKAKNLAALMPDHKEAVQRANSAPKVSVGTVKKSIANLLPVVPKECQPALGGVRSARSLSKPSGNGRIRSAFEFVTMIRGAQKTRIPYFFK